MKRLFDDAKRPERPIDPVTPPPAYHHADIVTTPLPQIANLAVRDFVRYSVLNSQTVAEVADWCGHAGEAVLLDAVLQRCESQGDLALSKVTVSTDSDDKTAAILCVIAKHPSISEIKLLKMELGVLGAAAFRDLLAPPSGQASHIKLVEFDEVQLDRTKVSTMRNLTQGLRESDALQALTIDQREITEDEFLNLLTSACQNVNLVRLTLAHVFCEEDIAATHMAAILASKVRYLCVASDDCDVHFAVVDTIVTIHESCLLASLELAGCDPAVFKTNEFNQMRMQVFWSDLAKLACLTGIVAVSVRDLSFPSDPDTFTFAVDWLLAPTTNWVDDPIPLNQSLLVFDHPGLDLGPELTRRFQELTHDNRKRFALPDAFFKGAARSFGGQEIRAPDMGAEIAKYLIPETGPRQDELRLALLNTTSYRAAMTGRSDEFRNELFKLIDGRKTGGIHTLRQMMLDAHVGLTEEHLEQVWRRARERGVELPDLPLQWLPPDRE